MLCDKLQELIKLIAPDRNTIQAFWTNNNSEEIYDQLNNRTTLENF